MSTRTGRLIWVGRCLTALAVFHLVMSVLAYINHDQFAGQLVGTLLARTRSDAETATWGALLVHLILAVVCLVLGRRIVTGRRSTRTRVIVLMVVNVIAGIAVMWLPSQTYLSPLGVGIALAALVLLWLPEGDARVGDLR